MLGEADEAGWGGLARREASALDPEYPARGNTVLRSLSCSGENDGFLLRMEGNWI